MPKPLKVVSIILIVLGIIRLVAGALGLIGLKGYFEANSNMLNLVIVENFVAGSLILLSGLLLLKGKGIGRIILIVSVIIAWVGTFIISGEYSLGTLIIFGTLIGVLFLEDSIKEYFSNKE